MYSDTERAAHRALQTNAREQIASLEHAAKLGNGAAFNELVRFSREHAEPNVRTYALAAIIRLSPKH